ncbi:MAG: HrpB1 family type III secretion system apparatus protein [Thermodesulforhabdaceae bacterium]
MEFESRLVKILMELGMMASGYHWKDDAEKIFTGLRVMRPQAEEPFIGLALMWMMAGSNDEAVQILKNEALSRHPESEVVKAYLALALKLSGRTSESEQVARELIAAGKNEKALQFVENLLKEM